MRDNPSGVAAAGTLRDRTRRAVRKEIAEAAHHLFLLKGYQATTVQEIADAAQMSARSLFRYFSTKGDVILGKWDFTAESLLVALRERPLKEREWESFRHVFAERLCCKNREA